MKYFIDLARRAIRLDRISNSDKKWIYHVLGSLLAVFSFGLMGCIYQPLFIIYLCIYLVCLVFTKFLEKIHLLILVTCLLCLGISGLILYRQPIILFASISSTLSMFISWLSHEEVREIENEECIAIENIQSQLQVQIDRTHLFEKDKVHTEKEIQKLYADLGEQTDYINSLKELICEQQYTISTLLHQKEESLEHCRTLHKEFQERQCVIATLENKLQSLHIEGSDEVLIDHLNALRLQHFQYKLITDGLVDSNLDIEKIRAYMGNFIQLEEELYHKLEDIHDLRLAIIYLESTIARMRDSYEQLLQENRALETILAQYIGREELYQVIDCENDFLERNIKVLLPKKKKKTIAVEVE